MTNSRIKLWIPLALILLILVVTLRIWGPSNPRDETWYCYDTKGHPVEGVVIVCHYGLAHSDRHGVNCRVSDATGKVVLDLDDDTPRGLIRGYTCVYSPKLQNGDVGLGERWHKGEPVPNTAVYFDEWNNKIYLKDATEDPVMWHAALNHFIAGYSVTKIDPHGGAKLDAQLAGLAFGERARFLGTYGEQVVPAAYLATGSVSRTSPYDVEKPNAGSKFKDVTLPFQEQKCSCYSSEGHVVTGAILVYHSGVGGPGKGGIKYGVSDNNGRITLEPDEGMTLGVKRIFDCAYSPSLHCGSAGLGVCWQYPQPIPEGPVYFDDWDAKRVFFKDKPEDPAIWHAALEELISAYSRSMEDASSGQKPDAFFSDYVTRERTRFLEKYGEQTVPEEYRKTGSFQKHHPDLPDRKDAILKFKDITPTPPKS